MAFFGVTIEKIGAVKPIPNADRIEAARLDGLDFEFVVGKGSFSPGDKCVYFPVDSLLPQELAEKLGVAGKLAGRDKNRVKTVRLRGQISQGIVGAPSLLPEDMAERADPAEITAFLGVEKYEPPEIFVAGANLVPLPGELSVYDIEGADRYTEVAQRLMDEEVVVTEKVEGMNFCVLGRPDGSVSVCQRTKEIKEIDGQEHTFWATARRQGLTDWATRLAAERKTDVALYGEMLGPSIQGNIYKLKGCEVRLFDVKVGGKWCDYEEYARIVADIGEQAGVPVLFKGVLRDWLDGKTIKDASNGRSALADTRREGIVIRPVKEQRVDKIGRLILKQRSPEYLAKNDN